MSQLKAPNGKPSNLTPEQWKLVRTPQFKAWFGDWENKPENASKVIDENGEPLVVYHGTSYDFNVFKIGRMGGLFFTDNLSYAERFASGDMKRQGEKSKMLKCFLNARKCYDKNTHDEALIDDYYNKFVEEGATKLKKKERLKYVKSLEDKYKDFFINLAGFSMLDSNRKNHLLLHNYDCIITDGYSDTKFYVVFESNQIKLADGTNTTFDGSNPDIRFAEGGTMKDKVDELYELATQKFEGNGYEVNSGSNSITDYGHSRYFYVNQNNESQENLGLGFQVRVSDHSTGDRRILNREQFIFNENDVEVVFNRINYFFHPEEYKNIVMVKNKVVEIEVGENDLQPTDSIISERIAKSGSKRYTIKRTYKNDGVVPTHIESGFKLPFKPNSNFLFEDGGNLDDFDLGSIISDFGLEDIIDDLEKKAGQPKKKRIVSKKTAKEEKIFGDFIFADDDPSRINYGLRDVAFKFIQAQNKKEANTPEETKLLLLLKQWTDSIAESDNIAASKPLLIKLKEQYPLFFAPEYPIGTIMFRGLSRVNSSVLVELKKLKLSDFIVYKEDPKAIFNYEKSQFVLVKKPIDYSPSKPIQSWTHDLHKAKGFYGEGMLITKQDNDFFINENTLEKIYGSDEQENIHIGKKFDNNVYLCLRLEYFYQKVLPYLLDQETSDEPFEEASQKLKFANGGNTNTRMKKIKRGGITYGKSHAKGGIPVKNESTGDMLEVEGGEGIVNKRSMASNKKVKLNGKEMTICEAVSQLNQLEGGVQFSCDDVSDRQFIEAMAKGGELERGTRTEQEHIQVLRDLYAKRITPKQASKRIAKDHLKEDNRYYSKLSKMEGKMADGGEVGLENTKKLIKEIEKHSNYEEGEVLTAYDGEKYRYDNYTLKYKSASNWLVLLFDRAMKENTRKNSDLTQFFYGDDYSFSYDRPTFKGQPNGTMRMRKLVILDEKMEDGGKMFDRETDDLLSDIHIKYAKGGSVDTTNIGDYADEFASRKNKFLKANDEYQLLVTQGLDVKENKKLPKEEKDQLLEELRKKATEAKSGAEEERKEFVDMREVKSPFYAPQLADGGTIISKANKKAIDKGASGKYKLKFKDPSFPQKGIDVFLYIDSQSMRGTLTFSTGTRNLFAKYDANWKGIIDDILTKHLKIAISSYKLLVEKKSKSLDVQISFYFAMSFVGYEETAREVLKAITSYSYYEKTIIDKDKNTSPYIVVNATPNPQTTTSSTSSTKTQEQVTEEVIRWTILKQNELNDLAINGVAFWGMLHNILENKNNGTQNDFDQLIDLSKKANVLKQELIRLDKEGFATDSFIMKLLIEKFLLATSKVEEKIVLFAEESNVQGQLNKLEKFIPYLAGLDTFDKEYIINIK